MNEVKKLTKSQRGYLLGIREKHNQAFQAEINRAVNGVIEELGLGEDLKSGAKVQFATDYSMVTITKAEPTPAPKKQPVAKVPGKLKK
jgi:hypothetical protein